MGPSLTPQPHDDRWTAPAIDVLRAAVLLDMPYELAMRWAAGESRTILGTRITTTRALVPAIEVPDGTLDLPLVGLAGIVLLRAMDVAGADPDVVAKVVLPLQEQLRVAPIAATSAAPAILPDVLAAAATDRAEPSLLAPLEPQATGWRFGPVVRAALAGFTYDEAGWVRSISLPGGPVVVRAGGAHPEGAGDVAATARAMFLQGRSIAQVAAALECSTEEVEAALRLQV